MDDLKVIAIDFGTAYSGYAYNLTTKNKEIDPYLKHWGKSVGRDTTKTPTCILFDEHEEFLKFGYEANTLYMKMHKEDAQKHFFFIDFKMALFHRELNNKMKIKAANGKSMEAIKVFTAALKYMMEDALETINRNTCGKTFMAFDFTWVLTVPAIWDHAAKQFMREAAKQAGIVKEERDNKLVIALEPEAASLWCKTLPPDGFITETEGGNKLDQSPGTQYIVVDCGGGTIDIAVHEVEDGGALKELHKAMGNDLGGQNVDRNFKHFLREIFCDDVWVDYERKYPSEVQRMMDDFTYFKQVDEDIQICCPLNLGKLAEERKNIEKFFETVKGASYNDGWITISRDKLQSFFEESLKGVTNCLTEILQKDLNIEFILLVGGFAQSLILVNHISNQFGNQCKVLCPVRAQEAIMRGAVMFGINPAEVKSRKSAYTYGLAVSERFAEYKHKTYKKYSNEDGDWCNDIFMRMVEIDEDVFWDESREHILSPTEANQTKMKMEFYRTKEKIPDYKDVWGIKKYNVRYTDEVGMEECGSFVVNMPNTTGGKNRKVKLEIRFGSTEITATATDQTSGSSGSIKIDFMTKE